MRSLLFFLCYFFIFISAHAAEPFFKKDDVIALVGGEDMVVASEYGYLELLLTRALPNYHLRFRNLAWEGDTVFEQRRDLNFPTWEEQLDKIGATVVIAQFGQMESLAGKEKLPEFIAAYEKLLERFSGEGKRRVVMLVPTRTAKPNDAVDSYDGAIREIASKRKAVLVDLSVVASLDAPILRDGVHLNARGEKELAWFVGSSLDSTAKESYRLLGTGLQPTDNVELHQLLALLIAKNRLWFDYWRPQNWAFLAGDRVNQPSSRDWRDPSIRWFPPEREQFLPLIEAKEKEIDALAQKLAQP